MAIDVNGATVAITGAARGIGRATAQTLVRHGATVVIGDLDEVTVHLAAAELGEHVHGHVLDVTRADSFAQFLDAAATHGPLDVLINNAGIWRVGDFLDQSLTDVQQEIAVNLGGTVTGTALALPGMVARDRGHIINVSSLAGKMTLPGAAGYGASKSGVAALGRTIRAELPTRNVRVSTIYPATVATALQTGISLAKQQVIYPEDVAEAILRCIKGRSDEIVVPRTHAALALAETLVPARPFDALKRKLTLDTLKSIDHGARGEYYADRSAPRAGQ
ncbi:MAG: SDR family NAD(P)-dependent oxidoreductase [Solirubrobacteraceae bacterium]|nr:SDR family NAD(P)-dependent oxidoreductase [Solirubrobacteraceae bacterium]